MDLEAKTGQELLHNLASYEVLIKQKLFKD